MRDYRVLVLLHQQLLSNAVLGVQLPERMLSLFYQDDVALRMYQLLLPVSAGNELAKRTHGREPFRLAE